MGLELHHIVEEEDVEEDDNLNKGQQRVEIFTRLELSLGKNTIEEVMLIRKPNFLIDVNKLSLSSHWFSFRSIVQQISIEGIIDMFSLWVSPFGCPAQFQENYLDSRNEDNNELIKIVLRMVVEKKVYEEVFWKIWEEKFAA